MIIKGNNLIALASLLKRYEGKVKCIYIDPPYNTGNDSFGYNDRFNHSTWLVFMKNRLELAKRLLSDDGIIFVQIDNSPSSINESPEFGYILVLMDALQHFFEYEETTIIKNLKNKTIREMNWEVANETKTLNTGNYQIKMIKYIGEKIGLNSLSPVLEEAAFLRLNNPEDSLQSLADMINISKSGIRNRFRRIEEIYNSLLEEEKNS